MSDTDQQTPESAPTPATVAEGHAGEPNGPAEGEAAADPSKGLREARDRYRSERDNALAEVAAANAIVERYQREAVERIAGEHLAAPADFWISENSVSDYIDPETGAIDPERVAEDARVLISERPRLGKHSPAFDPSQGSGGPGKTGSPSWADLFR